MGREDFPLRKLESRGLVVVLQEQLTLPMEARLVLPLLKEWQHSFLVTRRTKVVEKTMLVILLGFYGEAMPVSRGQIV